MSVQHVEHVVAMHVLPCCVATNVGLLRTCGLDRSRAPDLLPVIWLSRGVHVDRWAPKSTALL
jgi:hypothetical protein